MREASSQRAKGGGIRDRLSRLFRHGGNHNNSGQGDTSTGLTPHTGVREQGGIQPISQPPVTTAVDVANGVRDLPALQPQASSSGFPPSVDGITILHQGGSNPIVDIVFVHGLMGDPIKTWAKGDVLWPKDVLSKSFPRARIMTYGYDADVAKFFQRVAAVSVFGNSQMLIRAVNRERRRSPGRPLIFIAHSLGGILVKDGLIWSKSQAGFSDIHVENVFLSTKGVIFLGTPHRGASGHYTQFGTVLQRVVSAMMYQTNPALLEALDRDGEVLPRIGEEWARMTHPRPFNMFSFVETLPMTVTSFVGKVVDENSGFTGLPYENTERIAGADHVTMAKFSSATDSGYRLVEEAVESCVGGVGEQDESAEKTDVTIYQLSEGVDYKADLQLLKNSLCPGTCEWIKTEGAFTAWLSRENRALFLLGGVGSGKSHVAASVVEVLQSRYKMSTTGDELSPLIAYFFCQPRKDVKTDLIRGMRSVVGQLAYQDAKFGNEFMQRERTQGVGLADSITSIWDKVIGESSVLQRREAVFLVIDGLDQCELSEQEEFLKGAYQHCWLSATCRVQLFISARPDVWEALNRIGQSNPHGIDIPTISTSDHNAPDIGILVRRRVATMPLAVDPDARSTVQDAILSRANGHFLWVSLKLDLFHAANEKAEIRDALSRLHTDSTQTIDQLYQKILGGVLEDPEFKRDPKKLRMIKLLLIWSVYSTRSIDISLLVDAVNKALNASYLMPAVVALIRRLGSVIEIGGYNRVRIPNNDRHERDPLEDASDDDSALLLDDGSGASKYEVVKVRHITFSEWYSKSSLSLCVPAQDGNIQLALDCLDTVMLDDKSSAAIPNLLSYAVTEWYEHLLHLDKEGVSKEDASRIVERLYRVWTTWDHLKRMFRRTYLYDWAYRAEELDAIFRMLCQSSREGNLTRGAQQWATSLISHAGRNGTLVAIFESAIEAAERAGFFDNPPSGSDQKEVLEYGPLLNALITLWTVAYADNPTYSVFLLRYVHDHARSMFWDHEIWKRHRKSQPFAIATAGDDNDPRCLTSYLQAEANHPRNPVVLSAVTDFFLRADYVGLDDCLRRARNSTALCRELADEVNLRSALVAEALALVGNGDQPAAFHKLMEAISLGNEDAADWVEQVTGSYPEWMEIAQAQQGGWSWFSPYEKCRNAVKNPAPLSQVLVRAILRQPLFSEWHDRFRAASRDENHAKLRIQSYKTALRLTHDQPDLLDELSCRHHLANAYTERGRGDRAVPLWTWILNNIGRLPQKSNTQDIANRLVVLTVEGLVYNSPALHLRHPLIEFANAFHTEILGHVRTLILLGKGLARQGQTGDANILYRRGLQKTVEMALRQRSVSYPVCTCLGNCLIALGNIAEAVRAFNWVCEYTSMDVAAADNSDSKASLRSARRSTSATDTRAPSDNGESLRMSWNVLCDGCMVRSGYTAAAIIFGNRYKCRECAEIDLCETCLDQWKPLIQPRRGRGWRWLRTRTRRNSPTAQPARFQSLRYCRPEHNFLKLPDSSIWHDAEKEAREFAAGRLSSDIRDWIKGLMDL